MHSKEFEIGLTTFEQIRASFPALVMTLHLHPAHVQLAMDIPAQPGLLFQIGLNLQNRDELHLEASALWFEWFPCTKQKKVDEYFEAISGLLSGEFRILEHRRGRRCVRAQLQRPSVDGWKTVASSVNISTLIPWPRKTLKVVQNVQVV
jgi:hypothetical protein